MRPGIFRSLIFRLLIRKWSYLPGMVLVRMARKARKRDYREDRRIEHVDLTNFAGSLKMRVDKNSYMGGSIYWTGFHHINEYLYLRANLQPNMTFVDAGANQGEFTLIAASLLTAGKVIAFEPVSSNFKLLQHNVALNGFSHVELNRFGLFDKQAKLPIYTSVDEAPHGGRHEGLSTLFRGEERSTLEETIDLEVFDDHYFDRLERFDFLKMDIEGSELYALKGMRQSLDKFRPVILIELNEQTFKEAGYTIGELLAFLADFDYTPHTIFRGKLVKCEAIDEEWGNYVFISR